MRIIGGTARGRKLKEPAGFDIRPTSDLVKESVFNIIQFDIEGRRVLDLFAGTGQLGIEALSRGAMNAVFVDLKPSAVRLIWENLKICGFQDLANVRTRDALKYIGGDYPAPKSLRVGKGQNISAEDNSRNDEKYDIIFLDPPYNTPLLSKALSIIIEFDKLNPNGIIICEMKHDDVTPSVKPPYILKKEYTYGKIKVVKYEREL